MDVLWIITRKGYGSVLRQEQNKNYGSLQKSQGYLWDCWMSILCVFLDKMSHKIHFIKGSIKIYILLNTKNIL